MSGKLQTYNFGRISILAANIVDKEDFLMTAFSAQVRVEHREFRYLIANEKIITYNGERFAYGQIVKYKRMLEGDVIDEIEKQITDGVLPYGVIAHSKFFIHIPSQVLAFHPVPSRISDKQFKEYLARLIEAGQHNFFVSAEVETIDEEIKISNSISLLKKVSRIFLDIRPTNPSNRPIYRQVDERLKLLQADREQITLTAGESGLDKQAILEDDIYKGLLMAADGYGKASVYGERDDGTCVVIRTDDSQVTKRVADDEDPVTIVAQLYETFVQIWRRTHLNE